MSISTFLKARVSAFLDNLLFTIVVGGGALLTSYYTAHSAYVSGIPLYKAIPLGALVFLMLALGAHLVSLILIRRREHAEKVASPSEEIAACEREIETLEGRISKLTSDVSAKERTVGALQDRIKELERDKNTADVFLRQYMTSNERLTREEATFRVELAKLKELTDKVISEKDRTIQEQSARIAELEDKIERGDVGNKAQIGTLDCSVREEETDTVLSGVSVRVCAVQGGHEYIGRTDKFGDACLRLPYGHYVVTISKDSYYTRVEGCLVDEEHGSLEVVLQKISD
jgi:hypothetical protein